MKKICIITDAARPQVNGVVRTLETTIALLRQRGYDVLSITPSDFDSFELPFYKEIRLAYNLKNLETKIKDFNPDFIHISTEGPLGWKARSICIKNNWAFTTAYHTKFPEFLHERFKIPLGISYLIMKWFHSRSSGIMTATKSLRDLLYSKGFSKLLVWGRGVDVDLFDLAKRDENYFSNMQKPILLNVGRVSIEKNLEAFLDSEIVGTKIIVGDGPHLKYLEKKYKDVKFLGAKRGEELYKIYASSDVFVFPSKTDTFGLVILEANAAGLPVAAFPVTGPIDIIKQGYNGFYDNDLSIAIRNSLNINKDNCREFATQNSWDICTDHFELNLVPKDENICYT